MTKRNDHTFAICAYKESPYLESCIKSVLNQSVKTKVAISTGTPNDYIRLQRLKRAASLLCESGYRVNEIASLTGFTSASYFTKCFHQHFGMLPKEFIKQSGSSNNLTE